jgi:hypothetical protein
MADKRTIAAAQKKRALLSTKGENPFFVLVAVCIGLACMFSLFVAGAGLVYKRQLMQGLSQIENIVMASRQYASEDHRITDGNKDDLIAILNSLGQVKMTDTIGGVQCVTNPWGGSITAQTLPNARIRVQSSVPGMICRRLVNMFSRPETVSNAQTIEIQTAPPNWVTIYDRSQQIPMTEATINNYCNSNGSTSIAITFPLH